jgi:2-phospho-L-lactate guanylyltransferase
VNPELAGKIWAVVPVKTFVNAKSRLAPVLGEQERRLLARRLLRHTLEALADASFDRVLVVSRDEDAIGLAHIMGMVGLRERARTLNQALRFAASYAIAQGATSLLVVSADLPLVSSADLVAMKALPDFHGIVIAPDRAGTGTNALYLSPPNAIHFVFGENSFAKHQAEARAEGLEVRVVQRPGLSFDLDTPEDLADLPRLSREAGVEPPIIEPVRASS